MSAREGGGADHGNTSAIGDNLNQACLSEQETSNDSWKAFWLYRMIQTVAENRPFARDHPFALDHPSTIKRILMPSEILERMLPSSW